MAMAVMSFLGWFKGAADIDVDGSGVNCSKTKLIPEQDGVAVVAASPQLWYRCRQHCHRQRPHDDYDILLLLLTLSSFMMISRLSLLEEEKGG